MQDVRGERSPKDDFPPIGTLPKKNIDTGMGIERVATLLQGVASVYDTDLVRPVIARAEEFSGPPLRRRRDRRRPLPGDRRPRPLRRHDHRRRRHPVQRRPRLRAAPPAAPDRALGPAARRARAGAAVVRRGRARRDGPVLPGARHRLRAHRHRDADRGGDLPPDAVHRLEDLRERGRRDPRGGLHPAARRPGVQAARHVRLPDRPDAGDGRRGRAAASTSRASARSWPSSAAGPRPTPPPTSTATPTAPPTAPCSTAAGGTTFLGYTDLVVGGAGRRARRRRGRGARRGRGHGRRGDPRPHPVLRRGRRPAGRHRLDPRRRVRRRRRRRAVAGHRARRAPRHRARGRDHRGRGARTPRSTPPGGRRSRGRTRPPTSCTRACARPSATPPRRRAR